MKTGYFARATEEGHRAKFTQVHIVDNYGKPICRYRPHKTMHFLWCAYGVRIDYVGCKECKVVLSRIKKKLGSLFGRIGG